MWLCQNYNCLNNGYGKCKLHQEKYSKECINFIPRNYYNEIAVEIIEKHIKYKGEGTNEI